METRETEVTNLQAAASHLRRLADMIHAGTVSVGGQFVRLPPTIEYEVELKDDGRKGTIEIEIEWHRQEQTG